MSAVDSTAAGSGATGGPDRYVTLSASHRAEVRIRSSRFIASAEPVLAADEARQAVTIIARRMHDATHHCWAYRLCGGEEGSSDAGEPPGTAGRPILTAIGSAGLSDTLVVVTRYFGGIKLGTGGLARAYREAAGLVLEGAPRAVRHRKAVLEVTFGFPQTGLVEPLLSRFGARKLESDYGENVRLRLSVNQSLAPELLSLIGQLLKDPRAARLIG
jgi:uncharacterized YigZ family protein